MKFLFLSRGNWRERSQAWLGTGICTACCHVLNKWAPCDTTGGRKASFPVLTVVTKVRNTQVIPQKFLKGWEGGADGRFLTTFHPLVHPARPSVQWEIHTELQCQEEETWKFPTRSVIESTHQLWPAAWRWMLRILFLWGTSRNHKWGWEKTSFLLMLLRTWKCFGLFLHDPSEEKHYWHYSIPWWWW